MKPNDLKYYFTLDCFVPRNDDTCRPSLVVSYENKPSKKREMTKPITGNREMWLNVLNFTGLLRKLAMTIHVAVIARNEAIQKTLNIYVLQNLSSVTIKQSGKRRISKYCIFSSLKRQSCAIKTRILVPIIALCASVLIFPPVFAQVSQQEFRVMFYNVENLFDTEDDPHVNDNEFLPNGARRWTPRRYYSHLQQTAKVINAVGEWDTPALVGLCEVENDSVMTHLIYRTPLRAQNYRYCITQGIDPRGINVALLYQRDKFQYIDHQSRRIPFSQTGRRSRDILHVWGRIISGDTLDVFVCHFPSRSGGEKDTEQARLDAAQYLRRLCDSLYHVRQTTCILTMGDFNDYPSDKSIQMILNASDPKRNLLNLFADRKKLNFEGSYKYQGEWGQLDQIMVSLSWAAFLKQGSPRNFNAPFLLTEDRTWKGVRPLKVYHGYRYEGGFSDHLPVVADFMIPIIE